MIATIKIIKLLKNEKCNQLKFFIHAYFIPTRNQMPSGVRLDSPRNKHTVCGPFVEVPWKLGREEARGEAQERVNHGVSVSKCFLELAATPSSLLSSDTHNTETDRETREVSTHNANCQPKETSPTNQLQPFSSLSNTSVSLSSLFMLIHFHLSILVSVRTPPSPHYSVNINASVASPPPLSTMLCFLQTKSNYYLFIFAFWFW